MENMPIHGSCPMPGTMPGGPPTEAVVKDFQQRLGRVCNAGHHDTPWVIVTDNLLGGHTISAFVDLVLDALDEVAAGNTSCSRTLLASCTEHVVKAVPTVLLLLKLAHPPIHLDSLLHTWGALRTVELTSSVLASHRPLQPQSWAKLAQSVKRAGEKDCGA